MMDLITPIIATFIYYNEIIAAVDLWILFDLLWPVAVPVAVAVVNSTVVMKLSAIGFDIFISIAFISCNNDDGNDNACIAIFLCRLYATIAFIRPA